jgi:hypothetical protein
VGDTGTMRAVLILAAIVTTLGPGDAGAQARRSAQQRLETERRADLVLYYVGQLDGAARALPANLRSSRLLAAVAWMRGKAQVQAQLAARDVREPLPDPSSLADVSDEYMAALQRATEVLRQEPSATAVEDVTLDLEAKVEHCRRLRIGMGGTVILRVNTRRDGVDVKNLEVQYIPKFFEFVKGATATSFPGASSPVERPVAPGRYVLWAVSPTTGERSALRRVDVFGQPEVVVDLAVTFP